MAVRKALTFGGAIYETDPVGGILRPGDDIGGLAGSGRAK